MGTVSYFSSFIIGAGIIQGVFQATVLLKIKKGNEKANRILAMLLLIFSANIAHSVLFVDFFSNGHNHFLRINEPFQFLIGPFFYFYVRQLTLPDYRFKINQSVHFIPFGLYCLVILPLNMWVSPGHEAIWTKNNSETATDIIWVAIILHFTVYSYLAHFYLRMHHKRVKECYSEIDSINLKWVKFFISVLLGIYIIYYVLLGALIHGSNSQDIFPHFQKIISIVLSLAVYSLGYRGLTQPQIFTYSMSMEAEESTAGKSVLKESSDAIAENHGDSNGESNEAEKIVSRLMRFMEEERPYLNPELTLPELSTVFGVSRNRLSQVLNEKIGVSFYDFINGYRVKQVQQLMSDPKYDHMKILSLAFDSGFNSKATFNSIFKKVVGVTPSEYRRQLERKE